MAAVASRTFAPIDFRTRFPALDGVRALAITLVFLEHFGGGGHGNWILRSLNAVRSRGWLGVDIFFVLSGFLITGILYDTLGDSKYLSRFFARRSLRILPLYYGVFLLFVVLTPLLHYQWRPGHLWWLVYLGNVFGNKDFDLYFIISKTHLHRSANISHFWSLCVEEQFYLVWPWIVYLLRDRKRLIATAIGIAMFTLLLRCWFYWWAGPFWAERWIVRTLPFRMDALLIGGILALLLRGPQAHRVQQGCKWLFFAAVVPVVAIFTFSPSAASPWLLTIGFTCTAFASAGLIGMTLRTGSPAFRLFNVRPFRTLGKISYGFYVFHDIYYYVWLQLLIWLGAHLGGLALPGLIEIGSAFLVTFFTAKLSFKYFESHFLQYKRHFEYDSERASHEHAFITALDVNPPQTSAHHSR